MMSKLIILLNVGYIPVGVDTSLDGLMCEKFMELMGHKII